jgi:hypothetical protein
MGRVRLIRQPIRQTNMDQKDRLTNLEHWRDLALAHPWPVGLALLSVMWLLILVPWPHASDSQIDLVSEHIAEDAADERVLDASKQDELPSDGVISAKRIRVVGHVLLTTPAVLVANEIVFAPNSRIWVPSGEIVMIAPHISNGVVDVSGADGRDGHGPGAAGEDGANGGSAFIAAAEFTDMTITSNGGAGGDGQRGYAGAAGRNGFCGPRGFGLAERGKSGGNGGDAGHGGSGGLITVWYGTAAPHFGGEPGAAGTPGRGGPGGRGGAGCKGVRGSQPAQSAGNEGAEGRTGSHGQPATTSTRHVKFSAVVDAYEDWLEDHASPDVLRERLARLKTIEG